jgi:dinuclear metal center YbgI/SA1388 family protein
LSYYDLNLFEKKISRLFPEVEAEDWDNVGLQIAAENKPIRKALITLDVNKEVVEYAKQNRFDLIISHHPLIFKGLKKIIAFNHYKHNLVKELLFSKVALFVLHTNLDKYYSKLLAEKLKLSKIKPLSEEGFGSIGLLPKPIKLSTLLDKIKVILKLNHLRYTGSETKKIKKIACIGGSGESFLNRDLLKKKVDVLITADIKYHGAHLSDELSLPVIDAGHYYTENIMMDALKTKLDKLFQKEIIFQVNKIKTDPIKFH